VGRSGQYSAKGLIRSQKDKVKSKKIILMENPSFEIYTEIVIKATPEKVWKILSDFANYPNWNPFIKSISGELVEGKPLAVLMHPPGGSAMKFTPIVLKADKNKEFRWLGKMFFKGLFDGEHIFELKDNGDGTTTFVHHEQFKGILLPLLKNMLNTNTRPGFEAMNQALKLKVES
jgi:hypothetical protein